MPSPLYRFDILNVVNGARFVREASELGPMQPEWGDNPNISQTDLTAQQAAEAAAKIKAAQELAARNQARDNFVGVNLTGLSLSLDPRVMNSLLYLQAVVKTLDLSNP